MSKFLDEAGLEHVVEKIDDVYTKKTDAFSGEYNDLKNIPDGLEGVTVDSELSADSENPVQNKVVKGALDGKVSTSRTINGKALTGNISLTATDVGADASGAADTALTNAKSYADTKIADLINGAPSTLDTLGEIATAMADNEDVVEALNDAIGSKANASDLTAHTGNTTAHITSTERTNWNAAKTHADSAHARTDATKVEKSSTNGNIKINGTETNVYTHPSGTNPHGTTKSDVGLGNVGNFKAVSTVASQGLTDTEKSNARANIGAGTSSFSGSYNDLSNKPTIPSVGNGTVTIKQAGVSKGAFTMNQSGNTTIELSDTDTTYNLGSFGITATASELNYMDGVTSNVQTQLDNKTAYRKVKLTDGTGNNIAGYRLIITQNIGTWTNDRYIFHVKSRYGGGGLVTIGIGNNTSIVSQENAYAEIKYFGLENSGEVISSDSYQVYVSSDGSKAYVFWRYKDYDAAELEIIKETSTISNGTWMTSIDTSTYGALKASTVVNHASSATTVKDYADSNGGNIKIGYASNGLTAEQASQLACYALINNQRVIKDLSFDNLKIRLGLGSAAYTASTAYAASSHTHDYIPTSNKVNATNITHTNYNTNGTYVPTMNFLSFWNGAHNSGGTSNLAYCNKGAFGDMATKTASNYALANHTHNYAGSSSAGGSASSAVKLDTATAGSATQPVYFSGGKPVATTYTLGKSVPSNAVFTDTHYISKNIVCSKQNNVNTTTSLTNGDVYLKCIENGAIASSHNISGANGTTVTADASGNIIINGNTTSATNTSSKLFLIGALAQAPYVTTYSHDTAYVGTDGCLYSNSTKVSVDGHTHSYLPLSGGTVTGNIILSNASIANIGSTSIGKDSISLVQSSGYAIGSYSFAQGKECGTTADYAFAHGVKISASNMCSAVIGKVCKTMTSGATEANQVGDVFVIGNGVFDTSSNPVLTYSNAFRVTYGGNVYGTRSYTSSGADYAEFIKEWHDGNENEEDRVGYFVTVKDNKLYKADSGDFIYGITSGNPSVVGNGDEDYYWKYERDEFNRIVMEDVPEEIEKTYEEDVYEEVETIDDNGETIIEKVLVHSKGDIVVDEETGEPVMVETGNIIKNGRMKLAEGYDSSLQENYVERKDRKEWDYVGMVGVVPVRDDGTCIAGQLCKCAGGGIATLAEEREYDTYMVIERISENVVSVLLK